MGYCPERSEPLMTRFVKTVRDEASYREVAGLWLGLASVLGLLGLFITSLAIVWTVGEFSRGVMPASQFAFHLLFFSSLVVSPALGWLSFARRRYWVALAVGGWPIVLAALGFANVMR